MMCPPPDQLPPKVARNVYHVKCVVIVGYVVMLAVIANLAMIVPSVIWALPMGMACWFGASQLQWVRHYRRLKSGGFVA